MLVGLADKDAEAGVQLFVPATVVLLQSPFVMSHVLVVHVFARQLESGVHEGPDGGVY